VEEAKGLPVFVLTLDVRPPSVRAGERQEFVGRLALLKLPAPLSEVEVGFWPVGRPEE
jgi:hypothetical protein